MTLTDDTAAGVPATDTPEPAAPTEWGRSPQDREARLVAGADQLAGGRRSLLGHPQLLLSVSAALMTTGLSAIILGWVGAAHSTIIEEQIPYVISGGLLGGALATIGALTLFAHWLTVLIKENRRREAVRKQDHIELMEALALLTAALDRQEDPDGRAGGAQPERAVRRAPRRR
jgi:hypothetical protein